MAKREITCVKKDAYGKITHIGGYWGLGGAKEIIPESDGIRDLTPPVTNTYYVKVSGYDVPVIIAHRNGVPYLRTDPDHSTTDNLANRPNC